jgi:esterase/lipase superfamily enzyme
MATVYYATDRQHVRHGKHSDYTGERSDPPGLHLGRETVALAPGHRLGCLDGAVTIVPDGALMATSEAMVPDGLRKSDVAAEQFATAGLRAAIRATTPPSTGKRRQVLVYVHGFNNGFDETIRKTAQLSTDLGLVDANGKARGVALAYSWPTMGGIFSYVADEENAEWTQQRLVPFLRAVSRICRSENADLCIIAHSMGARAVVRSLAELSQQPNQSGSLADHVILLAPDIGKGLFEQYVERFLPRIGHMTIYVSSRDRALALSTFLHGGRHRLGLFGSTVIAAVERLTGLPVDNHRYLAQAMAGKGQAGKMDMIDVSKGFAHQFGHTYSDSRFIHDVQSLLAGNTTPGTGSRDNLIPREISSRLFRGTTAERLRYFQLK